MRHGRQPAVPRFSGQFSVNLDGHEGDGPARAERERAAEQTRELAPEHVVEAHPRARLLAAEHALERGAVLQETWRSAPVPGATTTCGVHVELIGARGPRGDPWRE
jgi:hypothetical protein